MKNAYPEKPVVPYQKTSIEMGAVVSFLKSLDVKKEIKCSAYVMFRNESGNGSKGINNNYCGFQADSGRWPEAYDNMISGTVIKTENKTGKERIFIAFNSWQTSILMLIDRVRARGLYVSGKTHLVTNIVVGNATELATTYYREWVTGSKTAVPDNINLKNFLSMYKQAEVLF